MERQSSPTEHEEGAAGKKTKSIKANTTVSMTKAKSLEQHEAKTALPTRPL